MFQLQRILAFGWEGLLHILLPRTCFACGVDLPFRFPHPLCAGCLAQIRRPGPLICMRCGTVLPAGGAHCPHCRGSKGKQFKCQVIRSAWLFGPQSQALIHAFKYQGYSFLSEYLGACMAQEFARYPELQGVDCVLPVPLHPKKQRARGYNQSLLLAQYFCRHTGLPLCADLAQRRKDTLPQARLNRRERLDNMVGAFIAGPQAKGKRILLIDDVATTGATLEGCAVALKQAGAKTVMAFTLAREP